MFHGLPFLSLSVTSPLLDAFPGEYISCNPTTPRLNGGVGTPSESVESSFASNTVRSLQK